MRQMANKITQQIDEISKNLLSKYAVKASKSKQEHMSTFTSKTARANATKGEPEVRAALHKDATNSHRKMMNRHEGIKKAVQKIGEEVLVETLIKVGTYTNKAGAKVTMHRNSDNPTHHMLVHDGKVVGAHDGSAKDYHEKLRKDGFQGTLHEEVEINEISRLKITQYMSAARTNKKAHEKIAGEAEDIKHYEGPHNERTQKALSNIIAHSDKESVKREKGMDRAANRLSKRKPGDGGLVSKFKNHMHEETLLEWKAPKHTPEEVASAKKVLMKHPEADAIGQSIHTATRHFNYIQDACDHVYSNHLKDVSYEDYDKMKPHLIDHFKAHGLK